MPIMTPPLGCGDTDPDYYFLCDVCEAWGIGLETVASAGILASLAILTAFLILSFMVKDKNKKNMVPIQFLFILGTLGIFGLTFAFVIQLNEKTGPTRFLLNGVLFALCFSCLLAHAVNVNRLVRGKKPFSLRSMLVHALSLTFVQMIIAIQYIITRIKRDGTDLDKMERNQLNKDFFMLLIYVLVLMVLTFMISAFTLCGPYKSWRRHGMHIFMTLFFTMVIWATWISILLISGMSEDGVRSKWDDPLSSVALAMNGWVFLMTYIVPEICFLATPYQPWDYPPEKPMTITQRVEARGGHAPDKEGNEEDISFTASGSYCQPKNPGSKLCSLISQTTLYAPYRQKMMCSEEKGTPDVHQATVQYE